MRAGGGPPARAEILPLLARPSGAGAAEVMPLPRGGSRTCKGDRRSGAGRLGSGHASGHAMVVGSWLVLVALPLAVRSGRLGGGAPGGEGDGGLFICFSGASIRDTLPHSVPAHRYSSINTYNSVERKVNTCVPLRSGAQPSPPTASDSSADHIAVHSKHGGTSAARPCDLCRCSPPSHSPSPSPCQLLMPLDCTRHVRDIHLLSPGGELSRPVKLAGWGLSADAWALTQHLVRLPPDLLQHAAHLVSRL